MTAEVYRSGYASGIEDLEAGVIATRNCTECDALLTARYKAVCPMCGGYVVELQASQSLLACGYLDAVIGLDAAL